MKRLLKVFLLLFMVACCAFAQRTDAALVKRKVNEVASSITTLQCDFVQTKQIKMLNDKMVSQGKMYYQKSDKLRWEYTKPYSYVFLLNGNKVYLKNATQKNVIDVNQNKLFKEIARIMMSSVVGGCLDDDQNFSISLSETNVEWVATLQPKRKELKSLFTHIVVHFSKSSSMVTRVDLLEKNGDTTKIELKNVQKNVSLPSKIFSVD